MWLRVLHKLKKKGKQMSTVLISKDMQRAMALQVALENLLCVGCGYRIGFTEQHGSLGIGNDGFYPGHRYQDWRDCRTCAFAREVLAENATYQCDACAAVVPEDEVSSGMTSAGVEGTFCNECRGNSNVRRKG